MYSTDGFINKLNLKIKLKEYNTSIQMLKKEIIQIYIQEIKKINKQYKYTNILNLLEKTKQLLNNNYYIQLKKYFIILNEECSEIYELQCLINIYNSIREVEKNEKL